MSDKNLPPPEKRRIRRRHHGSTYHPVEQYSFRVCSEPGCPQLHVPQATGSTKCPECLSQPIGATL